MIYTEKSMPGAGIQIAFIFNKDDYAIPSEPKIFTGYKPHYFN